MNYSTVNISDSKKQNKYSIGDHVRKAINKGAFSKSYNFKNFSESCMKL